MNIKIFVATHKKYIMPEEKVYIPLHVGKEGKADLGYQGDNTGENISNKNKNYCELTGMYWMWKNSDSDYIGLCHYRRYFINKNVIQRMIYRNKLKLILKKNEIMDIMKSYDILLPKKIDHGNMTARHQFSTCHDVNDLDVAGDILKNLYPEYTDSFEKAMADNKMYAYNMFVMKKEDFNRYCKWLFSILFQLERRLDISSYDSYQQRIYGFISERLFNVWILNQQFKIKEVEVINIE